MIAPLGSRNSWYLRVSVTDRCNLRCVYCLPENARFAGSGISQAERRCLIEAIHAAVGLHKIRLTGGEPTLCPEAILDQVVQAKGLGLQVGLTSNGVLLAGQLPALRDAGLDLINISLDSTTREGFFEAARRDEHQRVLDSIRTAKRLGFNPVKINSVAMRGSDVVGLAHFARAEGLHLRFIELMPIGVARAFHSQRFLASECIRAQLADAGIHLTERSDRDEPTARVHAFEGVPPEHASLAFITTMSQPFCDTCDRIRLSSKGHLFTCLMQDRGLDLVGALRAGFSDRLPTDIAAAIAAKAPPATIARNGLMAAIGG